MPLIRIVYYSEREPLRGLDMRSLLATCERNNMRDEIGGFLHYNGHYFLQVLEGEADVVIGCYRRISADIHHRNLVVLGAEHIETRSFGNWKMGLEAGLQYPTKDVFKANFASSKLDPVLVAAMTAPNE